MIRRTESMNWWEVQSPDPHMIIPGLYLGTWYNGGHLCVENPLGIEAVLNLATKEVFVEDPSDKLAQTEEYPEVEGITYLKVPFFDGHFIPPIKFWECIKYLEEQHMIGKKKTLVHCNMGISRSPTIVASYLYKNATHRKDLPFDIFLQAIKNIRTQVDPSVNIVVSAKKLLKAWPYDGTYS